MAKPKGMSFIISRNIKKRPTLMHLMYNGRMTVCGVDTRGWSKTWFESPIDTLLCMRCKKAYTPANLTGSGVTDE